MIDKVSYRGWNNVYRISNGTVQLLVLADVGPRIISYSLVKGENILHEVESEVGLCGGSQFRLYGGHRLWVSPEIERTYFPDNRPVSVAQKNDAITFTAPIEDSPPGTNLQKELAIILYSSGSRVSLRHRIINRGGTATELSPWALTMLRAGGRAILPMPPRAAMDEFHYLPVGSLALWSYTDFADPRWRLGTEFIQLVQEAAPVGRFREQMVGIFNSAGWLAYFWKERLFLKHAAIVQKAAYPDFGCNLELFTNPDFLELETLGPKVLLRPGECACHSESWELFSDVPAGEDDHWIRAAVLPLVTKHLDWRSESS